MRKLTLFCGLAGLAGLALTISIPAADPANPGARTSPTVASLFGDKVLARGKGFEIRESQVEEAFTAFRATAAATGRSIPERQRSEVEKETLDRLINVQLLQAKATARDRSRAQDLGEQAIAQYRTRFPNDAAFKRQLIAYGISYDKFRDRIIEESLFSEILNREIKMNIKIADEAVMKFYQENPSLFSRPEMVRVSHILLVTDDPITRQPMPEPIREERRQIAEKLSAKLKAGEDFGKLAREYSQDPKSRMNGGELPPFPKGRLMAPEFDEAAFNMTPGQISGIVETRFGFHLIKLHEKIPAQSVSVLDAAKEIKEVLADQELQKLLPGYFKKLQEDAKVEILDPNRKP